MRTRDGSSRSSRPTASAGKPDRCLVTRRRTAGRPRGDRHRRGTLVEVFAPAADLQARSEYIQGVLKKMGPAFGTEWHHVKGTTLLRVSGKPIPSVNDQYTAAFGS